MAIIETSINALATNAHFVRNAAFDDRRRERFLSALRAELFQRSNWQNWLKPAVGRDARIMIPKPQTTTP